jgi:hypothetical protein
VGVQVLPVGQGALLPTVHGITGGAVGGGLMQRPPQGMPVVQTCVGVQVQLGETEQGALFPTVQGMVYWAEGGIVESGEAEVQGARRRETERRAETMRSIVLLIA